MRTTFTQSFLHTLARPTGTIGKVTGGWQIAGITYLRTGQPFSVAFNTALAGWAGGRADILRNPNLSRSERNEYRWFDTSAFAVPREFTYGNSSRNLLFAPDTTPGLLLTDRVEETGARREADAEILGYGLADIRQAGTSAERDTGFRSWTVTK